MDDYHAAHPHAAERRHRAGQHRRHARHLRQRHRRAATSAPTTTTRRHGPTRPRYWWTIFAARPWLSGGFVWTGFDYRGEPTPYGWPCINSHFGILDTCGFPKDNFYYYQAWWSDQPVLHLLPHWNWPGKEGQEIDVALPEQLRGGRTVPQRRQPRPQKAMPRNSQLQWKVPYAPGTLWPKATRPARSSPKTRSRPPARPPHQAHAGPRRHQCRRRGRLPSSPWR